jgi:hydroxyacylglutathione hydrolase
MIVKQIWTGNAYRNFNYLIACPQTGEAMAIDPLDHRRCLDYAKQQGWQITQVLNTHHHGDHTGGNAKVISATGARLLAHQDAGHAIEGINQGLSAGDVVKVGSSVDLEVLDTPGHTMSHVCLLSKTDTPALFCGDTLFNAGAGNCHNGGHPEELYQTFVCQLSSLDERTQIYPGHDYLENNLKFTLDREPGNQYAKALLDANPNNNPAKAMITTMAEEKKINTFFRLENPEVIDQICDRFPELGSKPDNRQVFLKLRELRNNW